MKLTPELLLSLGFRQVEPGSYRGKMTFFRYEVPKHDTYGYYSHEIQVSLGDYPESNPNSGIVSTYFPKRKVKSIESESLDVEPTQLEKFVVSDGMRHGHKWRTIGPSETAIAHHVTTLERLNAIYTALTDLPPLTPTAPAA